MDTAIFLSNRKKLLVLILSPSLLIVILYTVSSFYFKSVKASLAEHKAQAESAPIIAEKIKQAQEILKSHEIAKSQADIIQMLNEKLEDMASKTNFTLSLLTVEPVNSKNTSGDISVFKVAVKGKGSFVSVIKFFNETYTLGRLFSVETASLRAEGSKPPLPYEADFVLSYHAICK